MTWTRRTLLGGIASASVPLAGCSMGGPEDGSSDGGTGGGDFERVAVEGQTLVVGLGEVSADTVNVIAPDGTAFASQSVAQGATTVEVDIGLSYEPGEYQVVASAEDSTVAETALTIAPELEILEVGVGANHLDRMPEELGNTKSVEALITVANRGNGPAIIEKLLLLGDLPNPTTDIKETETEESSGIFDEEEGAGELSQRPISGKRQATLYTSTLPFAFQGDGVDCSSSEQMGQFEVRLLTRNTETSVTAEYSVQYTSAEEYDECEISIEGRQ